jgi:hypothetical protein
MCCFIFSFPFLPDSLLAIFELRKFFIYSLLIHLYSNHLHDLDNVAQIFKDFFFWKDCLFKFNLDITFNCSYKLNVILCHKGRWSTSSSCTSSSANSVHVVLWVLGHIEIKYKMHWGYIEATGGNVSSHQYASLRRLKASNVSKSLLLAQQWMDVCDSSFHL